MAFGQTSYLLHYAPYAILIFQIEETSIPPKTPHNKIWPKLLLFLLLRALTADALFCPPPRLCFVRLAASLEGRVKIRDLDFVRVLADLGKIFFLVFRN